MCDGFAALYFAVGEIRGLSPRNPASRRLCRERGHLEYRRNFLHQLTDAPSVDHLCDLVLEKWAEKCIMCAVGRDCGFDWAVEPRKVPNGTATVQTPMAMVCASAILKI